MFLTTKFGELKPKPVYDEIIPKISGKNTLYWINQNQFHQQQNNDDISKHLITLYDKSIHMPLFTYANLANPGSMMITKNEKFRQNLFKKQHLLKGNLVAIEDFACVSSITRVSISFC